MSKLIDRIHGILDLLESKSEINFSLIKNDKEKADHYKYLFDELNAKHVNERYNAFNKFKTYLDEAFKEGLITIPEIYELISKLSDKDEQSDAVRSFVYEVDERAMKVKGIEQLIPLANPDDQKGIYKFVLKRDASEVSLREFIELSKLAKAPVKTRGEAIKYKSDFIFSYSSKNGWEKALELIKKPMFGEQYMIDCLYPLVNSISISGLSKILEENQKFEAYDKFMKVKLLARYIFDDKGIKQYDPKDLDLVLEQIISLEKKGQSKSGSPRDILLFDIGKLIEDPKYLKLIIKKISGKSFKDILNTRLEIISRGKSDLNKIEKNDFQIMLDEVFDKVGYSVNYIDLLKEHKDLENSIRLNPKSLRQIIKNLNQDFKIISGDSMIVTVVYINDIRFTLYLAYKSFIDPYLGIWSDRFEQPAIGVSFRKFIPFEISSLKDSERGYPIVLPFTSEEEYEKIVTKLLIVWSELIDNFKKRLKIIDNCLLDTNT